VQWQDKKLQFLLGDQHKEFQGCTISTKKLSRQIYSYIPLCLMKGESHHHLPFAFLLMQCNIAWKVLNLLFLYVHFFGMEMYAVVLDENFIIFIRVDSQVVCCIVSWIVVVTRASLTFGMLKENNKGHVHFGLFGYMLALVCRVKSKTMVHFYLHMFMHPPCLQNLSHLHMHWS